MRFSLCALLLAAVSTSAAGSQAGTPCSGGQSYDDGMANETYPPPVWLGPGTVHVVSRFTPSAWPFHYDRLCLYLEDRLGTAGEQFDVQVYDDDNFFTPGDPGTLLASIPVTMDLGTGEWVSVDLGCQVVTAGSVWMGVHWSTQGALGIGADTDRVHVYRYSMDGAFWGSPFPGEGPAALMIRAEGAPGTGRAHATQRNGSGVNDLCYQADPPVTGTTWTARVSHDPTALASILQMRLLPATGPVIGAGELLVDLSSARLFSRLQPSSGTVDLYSAAVPSDPTLIGFTLASQAAVRGPAGFRLCNAVDLVVGCR